MSVMRPETVGSVARSSRMTAVAAPVRPELNTGSLDADDRDGFGDGGDLEIEGDVLGDAEAQRHVVAFDLGDEARQRAVTVYGPPTRMPGMTNRPSACDHGFVGRARGLVDGDDGRAGDHAPLARLSRRRSVPPS